MGLLHITRHTPHTLQLIFEKNHFKLIIILIIAIISMNAQTICIITRKSQKIIFTPRV